MSNKSKQEIRINGNNPPHHANYLNNGYPPAHYPVQNNYHGPVHYHVNHIHVNIYHNHQNMTKNYNKKETDDGLFSSLAKLGAAFLL